MLNRERWNEIIQQHVPSKGVFVEVGANDGESYSNTAHLADEGWKGFYFEPVLEYAAKCEKRHENNDVEVFPVGVGIPGVRTIYTSNLLSTFKGKDYQDQVTNLEWFKGSKFKPKQVIVMPPSILPPCDVLVIDVEGLEAEILHDLVIRPKVLLIELHEESPDWQKIVNTQASVKLLEQMGYTKVYKDDIDSIFIL